MREQCVTVNAAAKVIRRSTPYLQKRLTTETYLLDLPVEEIDRLARFFGVPPAELGG